MRRDQRLHQHGVVLAAMPEGAETAFPRGEIAGSRQPHQQRFGGRGSRSAAPVALNRSAASARNTSSSRSSERRHPSPVKSPGSRAAHDVDVPKERA